MPESTYLFGSDRALLYDVDPWNKLGFGVPNFGNNPVTVNKPIWQLAKDIAQAQLFIMTRTDAAKTQAPSRNNIERLGKILNRVASVLNSRARKPSDLLLEENHASADPLAWSIHPVPYFISSIVRNKWLSEYNRLCVIALTNIYQHSDNNIALNVTERMARDIYVYFQEMKLLLGTELLLINPDTLKDPGFIFTQEHYDTYQPENFTLNLEALDTPGPLLSIATEDDLRPLMEGIPSTLIAANLKQYPVDPSGIYWSGASLPDAAASPGTIGSTGVAPAGSNLGTPQL